MKRQKVKFEYDRDADAAYLSLRPGKIEHSDEVKPGIIVDFDPNGGVIGVEILRFARRFISQVADKSAGATRSRPLKKSA